MNAIVYTDNAHENLLDGAGSDATSIHQTLTHTTLQRQQLERQDKQQRTARDQDTAEISKQALTRFQQSEITGTDENPPEAPTQDVAFKLGTYQASPPQHLLQNIRSRPEETEETISHLKAGLDREALNLESPLINRRAGTQSNTRRQAPFLDQITSQEDLTRNRRFAMQYLTSSSPRSISFHREDGSTAAAGYSKFTHMVYRFNSVDTGQPHFMQQIA